MKTLSRTADVMTVSIVELTCVKVGRDRAARITFHTSVAEAETAAEQARADGYCVRLQSIPLPANPKALASLLQDYVGRLGLGR